MTPTAYLAIGCGLLALWFVVQIIRAPKGHEDDGGFHYGDVPHLPDGIGNMGHFHGRGDTYQNGGIH